MKDKDRLIAIRNEIEGIRKSREKNWRVYDPRDKVNDCLFNCCYELDGAIKYLKNGS